MSQFTRRSRLFGIDTEVKDYARAILDNGGGISMNALFAVDAFVKGCKKNRIWDLLTDVGLLAGPDNLNGALVKLKYTPGTRGTLVNFNFVDGDYNKKTGLVGNGANKFLDTGHLNSLEPQNNAHKAVYVTAADSTLGAFYIGCGTSPALGRDAIIRIPTAISYRSRVGASNNVAGDQNFTQFIGISRSNSLGYVKRINQNNTTLLATSEAPLAQNIQVFAGDNAGASNSRQSFYSIGYNIDLSILDSLITNYMNSI